MKQRYIASIGIIGIIFVAIGGGFNLANKNGVTSASISPFVLVSWVFFFIAITSTKIGEMQQGSIQASWWRKSVSFIYDAYLIFCLLFIPVTFLTLVIHQGGFPPPWSIQNSVSSSNIILSLIFLTSFTMFWCSFGYALHQRVRTPGMVLCNIDLRTEKSETPLKMAFIGVFAYYGVFIPIFNLFALGVKVNGTMQNA